MFSDADEPFCGEVTLDDGLVAYDAFRVPRAYWKVKVVPAARRRAAVAAYVMDHDALVEQEVGLRIDIEHHRVALTDLERATQLRFPNVLHEAIAWKVGLYRTRFPGH